MANPGAKSLRAAMEPAKTDYLYFVAAGADPQGHSLFSSTLDEHNRNVAGYRHAVKKAGGTMKADLPPGVSGSAASSPPAFGLLHSFLPRASCPCPGRPLITQTVAPEELVARLNQRWDALDTLERHGRIPGQRDEEQGRRGQGLHHHRGHHPHAQAGHAARLGQVPVIGTRVFDMVSDGKNFTLCIPSENKAVKGSNSVKKKSANQLENMRPGFFLDAMVVRGLERTICTR